MAKPTLPEFTTQQIIALIHELNGNLAAVARRIGVTRQAIYAYKKKHPTVQKAWEEQRESMIDNAESVLYRKVLSGEDTTALIFFLKTQGHKRGYTEKHVHTGENGGPVVLRVVYDDDSDS